MGHMYGLIHAEIYSSSQSKEQNYSLKIVIYRIFLDLMLPAQFFFTILVFYFFFSVDVDLVFVENVMRFGMCIIFSAYKNSYEVTYVPSAEKYTTECKFIRWLFWD